MSRYYSSILNVLSPSFTNTYSLSLDGVDDYVKASLDGTSTGGILPASDSDIELTISFWFYMDGSQSLKGIFQWGNSLLDTTPTLLVNTDGASIRTFVDGSYRHTSGITMNAWHHYAITRTASTNTWQGYIDGVSAFTANDGGTLNDRASAIDFYFGVGYNGYLNGKIDEAAFWNSVQDVAAIYNSGVPNDISSLNPTAWYRNGDNGSYKSPQWLIPNNSNKDKVSNYSLQLDGVDDYINTGASTLSGETAISVSAWIYPTSYGGAAAESIISTEQSSPNRGFYLALYNNQNFRWQISTSGSSKDSLDTSGSTVTLNAWQHVLAVWTQSTMSLYINGVLSKTQSTSSAAGTFTTTNDLLLGARLTSAGFFEGNIDEVAVWNSDQSSNVSSIYNSGVPTTITGAVAHWKMGEQATFSTNWTVPDAVGSSDGTSANMTIEDRVGDAPNSTSNALSYNMDEADRVEDVPS